MIGFSPVLIISRISSREIAPAWTLGDAYEPQPVLWLPLMLKVTVITPCRLVLVICALDVSLFGPCAATIETYLLPSVFVRSENEGALYSSEYVLETYVSSASS